MLSYHRSPLGLPPTRANYDTRGRGLAQAWEAGTLPLLSPPLGRTFFSAFNLAFLSGQGPSPVVSPQDRPLYLGDLEEVCEAR
jgi:hypothetical protein